jgi:ribosome-associated protein
VESLPMKNIEINAEPIALYQLLKLEALVSSGGEAKVAIDNGRVLVNGEVETRRRKKIMSDDTIEFESESFKIVLKS